MLDLQPLELGLPEVALGARRLREPQHERHLRYFANRWWYLQTVLPQAQPLSWQSRALRRAVLRRARLQPNSAGDRPTTRTASVRLERLPAG